MPSLRGVMYVRGIDDGSFSFRFLPSVGMHGHQDSFLFLVGLRKGPGKEAQNRFGV